jgi:hypothetical protein
MSDTSKPAANKIECRVAQILNARELVINRGVAHGVTVGMRFAVLAEKPLEIVDPETNTVAGVVDREKVRVEASEVRDKFTICRTYRTKRVPGGALYGVLRLGLDDPPHDVPETLAAKDSSLPPPLKPEESYVKTNDRVIQLLAEAEGGKG